MVNDNHRDINIECSFMCIPRASTQDRDKTKYPISYYRITLSSPSWSPQIQSYPRTTLAFGNSPRAGIFLESFRGGTVTLCIYNNNRLDSVIHPVSLSLTHSLTHTHTHTHTHTQLYNIIGQSSNSNINKQMYLRPSLLQSIRVNLWSRLCFPAL